MSSVRLFLSRLNGWALSLLLHGGVAAIAGWSVFSVQLAGGSGTSAGGIASAGTSTETYPATIQSGDEPVISGTPLPDLAQYSRLTQDTEPETGVEAPPAPSTPVDIFAVGASEPAAAPTEDPDLTGTSQARTDPALFQPGPVEGRTSRLPSSAGGGQEGPAGSEGEGGSGGGTSSGHGQGEGSGSGDGAATSIYTPAPAYPTEARRRNIEGSVLVEVAIESDGSCQVRRILQSSGFSPLDAAVENTIRRWKYRAAAEDGRPALTTKKMRFTFKLGQ